MPLEMPAAPAAPSAPAPAAPAATPSPAPAAPAAAPTPAAPIESSAPATSAPAPAAAEQVEAGEQQAAAAVFTKGSPEPVSDQYGDTEEGIEKFLEDRERWRQAQGGDQPAPAPAPAVTEPNADAAAAETQAEKPAAEAAPSAVTPALFEEWTKDDPALAAALEANPAKKAAIMETARGYEAAKPILELVPTAADAKFLAETTNKYLGIEHKLGMAQEMPELGEAGFNEFVSLFQMVDKDGKPAVDAQGKPVMAPSFDIVSSKLTGGYLESIKADTASQVEALKAKLASGVYPNAQAKEADQYALEDLEYLGTAVNLLQARLNRDLEADGGGGGLPPLPAGATPEQIAFQKKLEEQAAQLGAGKKDAVRQQRIAARQALEKEVTTHYRSGVGSYLDQAVKAREARGEFIPKVWMDRPWVNPVTRQATNISDFAGSCLTAFDAKVNSIPSVANKLREYEMGGAAMKQQRLEFITKLHAQYMPGIVDDYFKTATEAVRGGQTSRQDRNQEAARIARSEPSTQSAARPAGTLTGDALRNRATQLCEADPTYADLTPREQAEMHYEKIQLLRAGKIA